MCGFAIGETLVGRGIATPGCRQTRRASGSPYEGSANGGRGKSISLLAFPFMLLLLLAACQPKLPPPPPERFAARANIAFGETRFTAAVEQRCPGSLRLAFSGLPELEGMVMQLEGGTAILRYGELELTLPTPSLPRAGAVGLLGEALARLAQPAPENCRHVPGGWEITGTVGVLPYTARVDAEGMLRSLSLPGAGLVIEFG